LGLGIVLSLGIGAFLYRQPHGAGAQDACPPDWALSPSREVRDRCAEVKHIQVEQDMKNERAAAATEAAKPQAQQSPVLLPQKLPNPTGSEAAVQEIPLNLIQDSSLVGITSMWQIDLVATGDQTAWTPMYVMAFDELKDLPRLETRVANASIDDTLQKYQRRWVCPQNIGAITITGVKGGTAGVVSFKSTSGRIGTFNIASQAWSFTP